VAPAEKQPILAQVDRVLSSTHFERSPALTKFLRYVVRVTLEGNGDELKEQRLGVDVFGRGHSFDPRTDPVVRIQAAKLRSKLAEYYADEGRGDELVISIPKGGYVPVFSGATREPAAPPAEAPRSIAVLPFVSMSGDPENEYFSDGLTEELINVLTYVPGLQVVARTSVFCFKGSNKDVREIGAQLNVRTVLEGSVRRSGDRLRVTAQLIDVASGYHLLSRTFPRELKDVFAVQEELASAVVTEIMPQIKPDFQPVVRHHTADLETYQRYLKATFTLNSRFTGARDSVEDFQRVLHKDPDYGPAWAGLAYANCLQAWYQMSPVKVAMPLARRAALRAVELDPQLGLAHTVLGVVATVLDWDWPAAEASFRKAIAAQPGLALAHQLYAYTCLMPQRRFREAIAATEHAVLLNPLDPVLSGAAMFNYSAVGDFQGALRQYLICREANPQHPLTYGGMGAAYQVEGRLEDALAMYRLTSELSMHTAYGRAAVGQALALMGDTEAAYRVIEELRDANSRGYCLCLLYAGLGNREEAIRWFEFAMDEREPHALTATFDPRFAVLADHPAFRKCLDRMHLPA
jgi:serine/threonine-protein kinase